MNGCNAKKTLWDLLKMSLSLCPLPVMRGNNVLLLVPATPSDKKTRAKDIICSAVSHPPLPVRISVVDNGKLWSSQTICSISCTLSREHWREMDTKMVMSS